MPEIKFTRDTGSYTTGDTATMGAGIAAHLVKHGAAEYTNGAAKACLLYTSPSPRD